MFTCTEIKRLSLSFSHYNHFIWRDLRRGYYEKNYNVVKIWQGFSNEKLNLLEKVFATSFWYYPVI